MWNRNPLSKNISPPPILVTLPSAKPFNALLCRVDLCHVCSLRFYLSLQHFPILPQAYISCAWRWNTSSVYHRTGSELTKTNSVRWNLSNTTDIRAGVGSPLNSCIKQMRAEQLVFKKELKSSVKAFLLWCVRQSPPGVCVSHLCAYFTSRFIRQKCVQQCALVRVCVHVQHDPAISAWR